MNKTQYTIYSFFITRSLFIGGCFTFLTSICKNNLIFCALLGTLLGFSLLYLFYKRKLPTTLQMIMAITILITNYLAIIVLTSTYFLTQTPTLLLTASIFILLLYSSKKSMETLKYFAMLSIPIALIMYTITVLGLLPSVDISNTLPFFNTSVIDFIKGTCLFTGVSLLPNLLLLNYKNSLTFKDVSKGYLLGSLSIVLSMFFLITIYGYTFCSAIRFPEYLILKRISITNYVQNIENILIMEWILDIFINSFLMINFLKEHTSKKIFYSILIGVPILIEMILNRNYAVILFIKNYIYYLFMFFVFLSLLLKKKDC